MDWAAACDYGSERLGFESLRARPAKPLIAALSERGRAAGARRPLLAACSQVTRLPKGLPKEARLGR
jgi:hypothetical protein